MVVVSPATATTRTMPILFLHAGCFFLVLLSNVAAAASPPPSFSFDFSNSSSYNINDLDFQGDARLNNDLVELTCNSKEVFRTVNSKGRMSYKHPVPFYDNITGEATSFTTSFTFVIKPIISRGDGMAFLLSGYPSKLPPASSGNLLDLINSSDTIVSGANRFVAIEFDTVANIEDPAGASDHIGIDLNSIWSVNVTKLMGYSLNGTMTATITFDGSTRMLEASLHFDSNHSLGAAQVKWQLPPLSVLLPSEGAVGFSASNGANSEVHQILAWSFNSTMASKDIPAMPNSVQPNQDGQVLRTKALIIGGAVVASLVLVVSVWWILSRCRWRRTRDSFGKGSRLKRFHYCDLAAATNNFSKEQEIGIGGFGVVYKGVLKDQDRTPVAVKQIIKDSMEKHKDFAMELRAVGQTGHGNIVRLEGWCCSSREHGWNLLGFMCWCLWKQNFKLFLVYEFVPNGNLHDHLHRKPDVLVSWEMRYKIVKGIASGLHYLHHGCKPLILHRDIKPCNILLDHEFNAKLCDFGLSRVAKPNETSQVTTAIGTLAYMDPVCQKHGQVDFHRSFDIYSFGLVLLEIAHGKNERNIVRDRYTSSTSKALINVADTKLGGIFNETEMNRVIVLGLRCSHPDNRKRPSMIDAMQFLEHDTPLPA